jgi:prevent-host-death family protein
MLSTFDAGITNQVPSSAMSNALAALIRSTSSDGAYTKLDWQLAGEFKMREVGASEVRNKFSALLDQVERGGEIVITRRGRAIAKLVPTGSGYDSARARRAANALREASKGVKLRGLKIKDLINQGRA